jgi:tetratricopeptide (TPR) repeat protein
MAGGGRRSVEPERPLEPAGGAGRVWVGRGLTRRLRLLDGRRVQPVLALCVLWGLFGHTQSSIVNKGLVCSTDDRDADPRALIAACAAEFELGRDPDVGLAYAKLLYRSESRASAKEIARGLLATRVRTDALHLLGRIALRYKEYDEARALLEEARSGHRSERRLAAVAGDEQALAEILLRKDRFAETLRMLDRCITNAVEGKTAFIEGYCHLAAARTLSSIGYLPGAVRELEKATPLLTAERDKAALHFERANIAQEQGNHATAIVSLKKALLSAERAGLTSLAQSIHLNLAYSLVQTGRPDEAERELAITQGMDHASDRLADRLLIAARIAHRRRDLVRALTLLSQADFQTDDIDTRISIAILEARVARELGRLGAAEVAARRGVELAEDSRRRQSAVELRSWVAARRREPYELLFSLLASADRAADAVVVFDRWYGRTLSDMIARPRAADEAVDLEQAALQSEALHAVMPVLSSAPLLEPHAATDILESARSTDLLIFVIAEETVWRIVSIGGALKLADLGRLRELTPLLVQFRMAPTDREIAAQIGELLIPAAFFEQTSRPLQVFLDGPLFALPLAAAVRNGRPLIAARPLGRPARLSSLGCSVNRPSSGPVIVMADARGDLPAARREAERVAADLGVRSLTGSAATSAHLLVPQGVSLLHISVHADIKDDGGALELYDRSVPALEIAAHRFRDAHVVLAACGSALNDSEGAPSLAMAFLAAGAGQVVATLRPITDEGAEQVVRAFYEHGAGIDAVNALAKAQRELVETANPDWPYFIVSINSDCN